MGASLVRILESGEAFWRSAAQRPRDEWLVMQFSASVTLSALTLNWHPDFAPSRYSIAVSADGSSYETVAIVVDGAAESRVAFAKVQFERWLRICWSLALVQ